MLNIRVYAYRTSRCADVWLIDLVSVVVALIAAGLLVVVGPLWSAGAVLIVGGSWTTRLRIRRVSPGEVSLTTFWLVIPVRRHRCTMDAVSSRRQTAPFSSPRDELVLGPWNLHCWRAERVVSWLKESAARLGTPLARGDHIDVETKEPP